MTEYLHPHVAPFLLEGDRPDAVLLLHGWTGSPAHLRVLGDELNSVGFPVHAPLLAGHGTSLGDMIGTGWRDWMRSALGGAADLVGTAEKLHLVGLSMGGVMALLLAPVLDAASLTTINAPQKVWDRRSRLANAMRGSARIERGEPPVPAPEDIRDYQRQYDGTPVGTVAELGDLMRAANRNLHRVTCPALIIQSKTDETVKPVSAEIIYDGIGSSEKGLVWLENSRHVALLDKERDVISQAILEHLERHSRPADPDPGQSQL
jgi:carboxylesterase